MTLSPLVRFGTFTWTYEGWQGQVYLKQYARTTFARKCLGEYCQYLYEGEPCFRTVGNDATFYHPPTPNQLRKYLNQIPEDFEMCFKVWEEITIPSYAKHARYGTKAGQPNGLEQLQNPFEQRSRFCNRDTGLPMDVRGDISLLSFSCGCG